MNTVLWGRSRDVSPETLMNMFGNGLDVVGGAVEKVMYGVSDGLAKDRKEKEQKEEDKKLRLERMMGGGKKEGGRKKRGLGSWRRSWKEG